MGDGTILVVAGEASGDLVGAGLARALLRRRPGVRLVGAGGARMREAGVELVQDATRHATVGIVEAFRNAASYAKLYRRLVSSLRRDRPGAVVLIDLPDFNIKFGRHVRECGIPLMYYVSPQVWAWRAGRVKTLARLVSRMLVIFEFEEELYRRAGVDVRFVGHPLLDVIDAEGFRTDLRERLGVPEGGRLIGLLPASRKEQFARHGPLLLRAAALIRDRIPGARFALALAPTLDPALARRASSKAGFDDAAVLRGETYDVMAASDLLLMASGTATVEATIFGTPMIVTYKSSALNALVFRAMAKVRHVSMANIIEGREVIPEFLQGRARPELIAAEAVSLIEGGGLGLERMRADLVRVREKLGGPGAGDRAAAEVLSFL
jgi:lipid-A-disaccharide synthase